MGQAAVMERAAPGSSQAVRAPALPSGRSGTRRARLIREQRAVEPVQRAADPLVEPRDRDVAGNLESSKGPDDRHEHLEPKVRGILLGHGARVVEHDEHLVLALARGREVQPDIDLGELARDAIHMYALVSEIQIRA